MMGAAERILQGTRDQPGEFDLAIVRGVVFH
jgi:hypothetical protein